MARLVSAVVAICTSASVLEEAVVAAAVVAESVEVLACAACLAGTATVVRRSECRVARADESESSTVIARNDERICARRTAGTAPISVTRVQDECKNTGCACSALTEAVEGENMDVVDMFEVCLTGSVHHGSARAGNFEGNQQKPAFESDLGSPIFSGAV